MKPPMRPGTWLSVSLFAALALGCSNGDEHSAKGAGGATSHDGQGGGASGGAAGTAASNGKGAGGRGMGGKAAGGSGTGGDGDGGPGGGISGGGCALPAYPDASCTGVPAGTSLTVVNGDLTIKTANTVIDGREIRGCVTVQAPGVVIRNSKVSCPNFIVISSFGGAYTGDGLLVEDSEIDCQNTGGTAMGDTNFSVRRVNIHGCENGFDLDGANSIEDSYIHDLYQSAEAHTDGAQITPVGHDITIRHNRIYSNDGTSAIISPRASSGVLSNVLIEENLMAGGAYTLYCQQAGAGNAYRVIDNHFSKIFYP
jgi:hypothetical protein